MPIVNVRVERIQEEHSRDERGIIWVSRETEFHDHACDSCGRIVSFGCEEEHCPSPTVGICHECRYAAFKAAQAFGAYR